VRRTTEHLLDTEREAIREAEAAGLVSADVARELPDEIAQRAIALRRPELVEAKPARRARTEALTHLTGARARLQSLSRPHAPC
jgi:hypothetical protein